MRPAFFWLALALLPTLVVAQPARAPKAKAPAQDPFSELFDTACMQHIGAPARLQSLMESMGCRRCSRPKPPRCCRGNRAWRGWCRWPVAAMR